MTKSYCERSVHYLSGVINLFLHVSADIIAVYITYMYFLYLCEKMWALENWWYIRNMLASWS